MPAIRVCGRVFTDGELEELRDFVRSHPSACRREIATWTCTRFQWIGPGGKLKEMSCRVALLKLQALGEIRLPPPRKRSGNKKPFRTVATIVVPSRGVVATAGSLDGLRLRMVRSREDSRLWNEAIHRFHYLGYKRLPGAQLRYLVAAEVGLLGAIGFGASAWKVAPRDRWIGWSDAQRKERLHLVVNNGRFLILPWVRCKNLASWTLAACACRIGADWRRRYGYSPVLLETFVQSERFQGTCYRAANWSLVGTTQGRGKLDRYRTNALSVKQIYVYPLVKDFVSVLCA